MKVINSKLVCWLCILMITPSAMGDDLLPTLDVLHNNHEIIQSTNKEYPESEVVLEKVDESTSPSVIIYNDVNNSTNGDEYYEVGFKRTLGEGDSVKYFKWHSEKVLVETSNEAEAVLTIRYNAAEELEKILVESGETLEEINNIYVGKNASNTISSNGHIKSISSVFAGNTVDASDHPYAYSIILAEAGDNVSIDDVNSSFIGNKIIVNVPDKSYGTLVKSLSHIGNIVSEFISNDVEVSSNIQGGLVAVKPYATIDYIQSDFINNRVGNFSDASNTATIDGGLISIEPSAVIGEINKSRFLGNRIQAIRGNLSGGIIYNGGVIRDGINNCVFNNNTLRSYGNIYGGIIANRSASTVISNSVFTGNRVSAAGVKKGVVLYTDVDMTIAANGGKTTEFSNNNPDDRYDEAIYVDDGRHTTLTLSATENGKINFDKDYINGDAGYSVLITGDKSGVVSFKNGATMSNANVTVENVNLDFIDNQYKEHVFQN